MKKLMNLKQTVRKNIRDLWRHKWI